MVPLGEGRSFLRIAIDISLGIMALVMLYCSHDFSMSGDEASQIQIGRNTYVYLCRVLGFLPGNPGDVKLDNYSGLFGVVTTNLSNWMLWWDEIDIRHFMIAITGLLAICYSGKTARLLWGRGAELLTILLLFCSPRFFGASMNNSKDIPFALGMIMSTYFLLCIVRSAPVLQRKHFVGLFFGLFIAIGVRIGALMFGVYALVAFGWLAIAHWRGHRAYVQKLALFLCLTALASFLAAIIFLPRVWPNIPINTLKALHNFSNYYVAITMLYGGQDIPTSEPPWHYLPVWVGITIPVVVVLFFVVSPLLLLRAKAGRVQVLLLYLVALFPWISIVVNHSPVYDAWRQFYFIYPPIAVLAGGTAWALWGLLEREVSRFAFGLLLVAGLLPPVLWSVRNHPLENVYFNELVGGLRGAYGHYETDFYGESVEIASRKLLKQEAFRRPLKDSVYVVNNVPTQINHYLKAHDPLISVRHIAYEHRDQFNWQYGVFATRSLDNLLERSDWPPVNMIDSVVVDGIILSAIVKRR
jgi:hypothetical protein